MTDDDDARDVAGAELIAATLSRAKRDLEDFERRYRNSRELTATLDVIKTARQMIARLEVDARRKRIRPV
jgi:hypothetical protein